MEEEEETGEEDKMCTRQRGLSSKHYSSCDGGWRITHPCLPRDTTVPLHDVHAPIRRLLGLGKKSRWVVTQPRLSLVGEAQACCRRHLYYKYAENAKVQKLDQFIFGPAVG